MRELRMWWERADVYKVRTGGKTAVFLSKDEAEQWYAQARAKALVRCPCDGRKGVAYCSCSVRRKRAADRILAVIRKAKYRSALLQILMFQMAASGVSREHFDGMLSLDLSTWEGMDVDEVLSSALDGMPAAQTKEARG